MAKKCFPHPELSDLPPTVMSKKRKAEEEIQVVVKKQRTKTPRKIPIEPKMPKKMDMVYRMIDVHPRYNSLDSSTRFAYEIACKAGYSSRNNNQFVRDIWNKLYLEKPIEAKVTWDRRIPDTMDVLNKQDWSGSPHTKTTYKDGNDYLLKTYGLITLVK
jgi:hypothetical protein